MQYLQDQVAVYLERNHWYDQLLNFSNSRMIIIREHPHHYNLIQLLIPLLIIPFMIIISLSLLIWKRDCFRNSKEQSNKILIGVVDLKIVGTSQIKIWNSLIDQKIVPFRPLQLIIIQVVYKLKTKWLPSMHRVTVIKMLYHSVVLVNYRWMKIMKITGLSKYLPKMHLMTKIRRLADFCSLIVVETSMRKINQVTKKQKLTNLVIIWIHLLLQMLGIKRMIKQWI
jgi:hypothetical protein